MSQIRVALFVEGAITPMTQRQREPLQEIWCNHVANLAERQSWSHVFPISKQHLENLDPNHPKASGAGEALDQLITRQLCMTNNAFDAAVVAWDLLPPLHGVDLSRCRRQEVQWLMERLRESTELPVEWKKNVGEWLSNTRKLKAIGPAIRRGEIRPLCMDPEFESVLLIQKEIRAILGMNQKACKKGAKWPRQWSIENQGDGKRILQAAIDAAKQTNSSNQFPVRGTMTETAPNEWSEWFLRRMRQRNEIVEDLRSHPIVRRVADLLSISD